MNSSPDDRDRAPARSSEPPKPDNPFIQFRQFADSQISSLLQSVIGLPSALLRRSPGDIRWTDVDEDLRRRDDLQARQRHLKEIEAQRANGQSPGDDTRASSSVLAGQSLPNWNGRSSDGADEMSKDVPLYGPVSKSLFAHLRRRDEDEADWKALDGILAPLDLVSTAMRSSQQLLASDQAPVQNIQELMYDALNASSRFRSTCSLMPYLLFSAYSPLKLEQRSDSSSNKDTFPYREAFEDLLHTSLFCEEPSDGDTAHTAHNGNGYTLQDSPLHFILSDHQDRRSAKEQGQGQLREAQGLFESFFGESTGKTMGGLMWLHSLNERGYLQPQQARNDPMFGYITRIPGTEQELYETIFRLASSPWTTTEALKAGKAILTLADEKRNVSWSAGHDNGNPQAPLGIMREIMEAVTKEIPPLPEVPEHQGSLRDHQSSTATTNPKDQESTDRVISTSTTSERTVHEDGTVETSLTVWKRFSSGRETSTTTHHCEDPASNQSDSSKSGSKEKQNPGKNSEKKPKSGWFWN